MDRAGDEKKEKKRLEAKSETGCLVYSHPPALVSLTLLLPETTLAKIINDSELPNQWILRPHLTAYLTIILHRIHPLS